jgi:hypothetical protein
MHTESSGLGLLIYCVQNRDSAGGSTRSLGGGPPLNPWTVTAMDNINHIIHIAASD